LPALDRFTPDIIFLSAGFDAHFSDAMNHDHIGLHEEDYEWLTARIQSIANKHCNGRVVSALEGGYAIHGHQTSPFARAVAAHVRSLANGGVFFFDLF
jgi:acetoin utilization deacetylase AcuC-like enzyme